MRVRLFMFMWSGGKDGMKEKGHRGRGEGKREREGKRYVFGNMQFP